jgi:hypothetical protein
MDVALWAILIALAMAMWVMFSPRLRLGLRRSRNAQVRRSDLTLVNAAVGPRRIAAATAVLEGLARRCDSEAIAGTWHELEGPLLEALPDCPPEAKVDLAAALASCAEACANRESAQGMMLIRNSLLEAPTGPGAATDPEA